MAMKPIERQDRLGTLLLMVLLTLVVLMVWWAIEQKAPTKPISTGKVHTTYSKDSTTQQNGWHPRPFNPNTANEELLREIGFSDYHIRNLMRYRNKGGQWRSVAHFQKLYGLTPEDFELLRPYIQLPQTHERYQRPRAQAEVKQDFVPRYEAIEKLQVGEQIDLSTADTSLLKRIPGIGSGFAKRIVAHRTALGGFTSVEQLYEITDLPADIANYCYLSTTKVKTLDVNTASYGQLIRHPYLTAAQVHAIITYRDQYGRFRTLQQLLGILPATEAERTRLLPYLVCL